MLALVQQTAQAVAVTQPELAESRAWAAAEFDGVPEEKPSSPGLLVLEQHDPRPFVKNQHPRFGTPLRLGQQQHAHGLFSHAPSRVTVYLPGSGRTFSAIAGVDSNEESTGGHGSVVFSVSVGNEEALRSDILREGLPGKPVAVDLKGATQFTLHVGDAGDGHILDQAAWFDARVVLADGSSVWLDDLPTLSGPSRQPYDTRPPFSFVYQGLPSSELLTTWSLKRDSRKLDAQRTERTLTYTDPKTGLTLRCVSVEYHDFPTVEWTLYFKNGGSTDTPILSDIRALDVRLERSGKSEFVLHHHKGTFVRVDDFEPLTTTLGPGQKLRFAPPGGRPLGAVFPYYNVEWSGSPREIGPSESGVTAARLISRGEGALVVIGWPGQWSAEFTRDAGNGLQIVAGQELTHLKLRPGEEIRTPLVVLQFYKGDWLRAQNVWRRWMLAHNLPRVGGELPKPLLTPCSSHQFGEMINANEENQKFFIDRYPEEGLKPDYWWMDAGWYVNKAGWPNTGTWEVDLKRFPRGLRAITDHAHAKGVKSIVWFEPERVTPGTWLHDNHPEWLLKGVLLNLGNPAARQWLTDHIDKLLTDQRIDLYRQDYNIDPLAAWRDNEAEDRQGITENHYVTGYLAYWDELRRRHPNMLIDSCASGGHRNDLETMRRALPFLRSDYIQDPVGNQCHTYGLSFWLPYHGTGSHQTAAYEILSGMACPHFIACWDMRDRNLDYALFRRIVNHWRGYADNYFGDFYPLTPYSFTQDAWMAWQFDQPEKGKGLVQVFRRAKSFYESARFKLHGLEAEARYGVTHLDAPRATQERTGRDLMDTGLLVNIERQPAAVVLTYQKLTAAK
ncbi:MAG: alpha-galactosidase [Verrucomicrobia bacterium]|nr:alpha-galactosidase [Verrucomicrobiota bacterium]